jgi:hypothetical protein
MTCLLNEGFESVIDEADFIARGWLTPSLVTLNGAGVMTLPSRTGQAGRGLYLRGPYSTGINLPCAATGYSDFGMLNTQQSIYSLWQAGGFAFGSSATFNRVPTVLQIAAADCSQLAYDGSTYYWAIAYNSTSASWCVAYSPDLINWTQTAVPPSATMDQNSTIQVIGSGTTATIIVGNHGYYTSTVFTSYYSTNMGGTWTAIAQAGSAYTRGFAATGSSTAPYISLSYNSGWKIYYYTSLSATPTALSIAVAGTTSYYLGSFCKNTNGQIIVGGCYTNISTSYTYPIANAATVSYFQYCSATADPTNAANWTALPSLTGYQISDMVWFNNRWVAVGAGGIWWNGAASGNTWVAGNNITLSATGAYIVWSVTSNGSTLIATGQDPVTPTNAAIWTSTDGVNWTKSNRFILTGVAVNNGNAFTSSLWDGSRFVISGGLNNNVIATSPDGFAWTATYYPDHPEGVNGYSSASNLGIYSGTQATTGVFTPWSTSASYTVGVTTGPGEVTSSATPYRTTYAVSVSGTAVLTTALPTNIPLPTIVSGNAPASQYTHYYEFIATATSTQNQFTIQWAIDGVIQGTVGTIQLASTTDTGTNFLFINLPRNGNFVMVDDMYLTNMNGQGESGQQGVINIFPWKPSGDVQDQFTPTSTTLSHAAQLANALSNTENSINSITTGQKDIYSMSATIPSGWAVKAVQVEAYFTKSGLVAGKGTVGVINGSTEVDSATVSPPITGANTYGSLTLDKDPNTGAAWTNAGFATAEIAVNKTA